MAVTEDEEIRGQRRMGGVMQALAWLVFLVLGVFWFGDMLEDRRNPNQSLQTQRLEGGAREVVLKRNRYGHYLASGRINGAPVTFLLDTGATGVALPPAVADRLGLPRGRPILTRTANGTTTSYAVALDSVSVGEIRLRDVPAAIAPGMDMDEVLLGMSFLRHIEFSQRGDTLVLRQY